MLQTASAFTQIGWHVCLVLPPWPRRLQLTARLKELDVDPAPEVRASQLIHPRWSFWPFVWRYRQDLRNAPLVYTRVARISLALARAGLPNHLEVHNVDALRDAGQIEQIVSYHQAGLIRTLIPISHGAARLLMDAGAKSDRVRVAPSGVKLQAYSKLSVFDPNRLERPRVLHMGRLSQSRGQAVLEHLARQELCEITIVSADKACIPNATYHPPVPLIDVPSWYESCDIALLPYQSNIPTVATMSPIKMFEVMAAARPIIASDLPVIREVLTHEKTALLVQADDLKAWEEAIERLRRDRALAVRLAKNAGAEAQKYSWVARARTIGQAVGL
jgi:glycosyltransferase involved in cell wall biosynthesis